MNFCQIKKADTANGEGMRVTLFVSGCRNHCEGCFQPETWNFSYGNLFTNEVIDTIIEEVSKPYYQGLTILGGDPFEPENQEGIYPLVKAMKEKCPDKDIWAYSGYRFEDIISGYQVTQYSEYLLKNIDVLVDGKFILEEKDITLKFRGSRNQRVIDLRKTFKNGKIIKRIP